MRFGDAKGQTAVEYAGLLALIATMFVALAALNLPQKMVGIVTDAVCELGGGTDCRSAGKSDRRLATATREDRDGDGLSNKRERKLGTSSTQADSDGDGIDDGVEVSRKLDPRSRDTDRDGIQDAREAQLARTKGTDPTKADSDGDGLLDGAELAAGTPAYEADADKDNRGGANNAGGRGDDLSDFDEIFRYGTDPRRTDTDEDGKDDGEEVRAGTNPLVDERSLGDKLGPEVAGILLDDPFGLGKGGALKKLGKGLDKLGQKLGIRAGKKAEEAVDDAADNVAAARKRREDAKNAAPAGKGTEGPLTREQDAAVKAALRDPNKLNHIFAKPEHNLGPLVEEVGSRDALVREAVLAVPRTQTGKFEITTQVGAHKLTVRGRVVDGVPRIGTLFSPP